MTTGLWGRLERVKEREYERDELGRFSSGGGGEATATETGQTHELVAGDSLNMVHLTTEDNEEGWVAGRETVDEWITSHGGEPIGSSGEETYENFHVSEAQPEELSHDERENIEAAHERFMNDETMAPLREVFGTPEFLGASRMVGESFMEAGMDPRDAGVAASWTMGNVMMYGDTMADESWERMAVDARMAWDLEGKAPPTTSYLREGGVLIHEYGHQVSILAANVDDSIFTDFINAGGNYATNVDDKADNIDAATRGISTYANTGGPFEAWSECFTLVTDPAYDRSLYDENAVRLLDVVQGQVERFLTEGVGNGPPPVDPNQLTLFQGATSRQSARGQGGNA